MLPYVSITNSTLLLVLCIDKFKGNSGHYKYQVVLLNGETHKIVDILKCRHKHFLCEYFKKFPKKQLEPFSNGPIEATNNKIKALKRTTFGMTKFENFKARIMILN